VREAAQALGLPAEDFGGVRPSHCRCQRPACAVRHMEGKALIQARGRWADEDIGFIYQRVTAFEMLDAVDGLGEDERGAAPELEAMLDGSRSPAARSVPPHMPIPPLPHAHRRTPTSSTASNTRDTPHVRTPCARGGQPDESRTAVPSG
jgi:hypothetical protein